MRKRIEFIDLLRGWAVIVMIETHMVNATLSPALTTSDFFQALKFINGLVAPSFLFASGLAYAVTTRRKLNDYLSFGKPLFKQVGRLLSVLLIGYILHLPKFNLSQLQDSVTAAEWDKFFQADVLQCIAVSLLFMQGMLLLVRKERRLYLVLAVLTPLILVLTPPVWGIDFWVIAPKPVAGYLSGNHLPNYSGFPIFPWSAFLFAGALFGFIYSRAREGTLPAHHTPGEVLLMRRILWAAPVGIALSFVIEPLASSVYPNYSYWLHSPGFSLLRISLVSLLCVALFFYERRFPVSAESPITLMGRESLIVYATHLLLIYGNFGEFNFFRNVNRAWGYGEAMIATIVLLGLMYGLAMLWQKVRQGGVRQKMAIQVALLLVFLGVFLFGPRQ